jgi:hypothetical protein
MTAKITYCRSNRQGTDQLPLLGICACVPVLYVFFADCNRAKASRAISDGACSGSGSTELTLISQST